MQESEAELNLKKVQELAKAEQAALIASEKAAQIEEMAEANLHVRSAQVSQEHSSSIHILFHISEFFIWISI